MNIAGLDLNLLHVFATIMKERNITRAGLKLGMSQPAVSNALNRLRHALKDDLFIRSPEGMRPTQRATELAMPISTALSDIENALKPMEFDPATAKHTFIVATADYSALTWMPHLASYLSNEAPGVNLHTIPLDAHYYEKLDTQEADFVCLPVATADIPDRFDSLTVEVDWFVCMMRPDHPLAKYKDIPLDEYAAARHLLVTPRGEVHGFADDALEALGMERRIVMTLNQFASAPVTILASDLILTAPSRIAEMISHLYDIHMVKSPIQPPENINGCLLWHSRLGNHPAHNWFRKQIKRAMKEMTLTNDPTFLQG